MPRVFLSTGKVSPSGYDVSLPGLESAFGKVHLVVYFLLLNSTRASSDDRLHGLDLGTRRVTINLGNVLRKHQNVITRRINELLLFSPGPFP